MDEALKLANEIYSGAIVVEYDDARVDVVCRALLDAHERIERLRVVLRQADQTERAVRAMRTTSIVDDDFPFQRDRADASIRLLRRHLDALPPGDMKEPPK